MSTPASTCGFCGREGTVSLDQTSYAVTAGGTQTSREPLRRRIRFNCACGSEWLTEAPEAETQGRFLDTARLR